MALLTKKKGSLDDLAGRLDACRKQLEVVEASLAVAARMRADKLAELAEQDLDDAQALVEKRAQISSDEARLVAQRDALAANVETLQARCAALATHEAEERVEALRSRLEPLARQRAEIEARLHEIGMAEAELHEEISDATDAVRWAASAYSDEAKVSAEAARRQESERVRWLSEVASREQVALNLHDESPRFKRLVAEAIEAVDAERGKHRSKLRADAIESWRPLVSNPETAPAFVRDALREEG